MLEMPDGTLIHDTNVIMEYLEDKYPDQGYSLLPKDPAERAKMRMAAPFYNDSLFSFFAVI